MHYRGKGSPIAFSGVSYRTPSFILAGFLSCCLVWIDVVSFTFSRIVNSCSDFDVEIGEDA